MKLVIKKQNDQSVAFPECNSTNTLEASLDGFAVRERGMKSGKHSVCILLKTPSGVYVQAQISISAFDELRTTVDEAKKRFNS